MSERFSSCLLLSLLKPAVSDAEYFPYYYFFTCFSLENKEWITFESKALNSIWCSQALLQWPPAWKTASRVTLPAQEPCAVVGKLQRNLILSHFRIFGARIINSVVFCTWKCFSLLWGVCTPADVSPASNVPDAGLSSFSGWLCVAGAVVGGHTTQAFCVLLLLKGKESRRAVESNTFFPNTSEMCAGHWNSIFCWNQQEQREEFWGRRRKRDEANQQFWPRFFELSRSEHFLLVLSRKVVLEMSESPIDFQKGSS